ncbi:MAG: T9SS type A sorting domain-containing protein [Flavobacteriales bacterium]|nr:T9SS type A sorting domain-containing protein [Flavobacteriales bacterium]
MRPKPSSSILRLLPLLMFLGFHGHHANAQAVDSIPSSVDIRLVQGSSPDQVQIQVLLHNDGNFGGILSALTATIRYSNTSGSTLGAATSFCTAWSTFSPSPVVVNNGIAYRTYNGFGLNRLSDPPFDGGCGLSIPPDTWFTVATIPVSGSTCTAFTLGNDSYTHVENRDFYVSMNGVPNTGQVIGGPVMAGTCTLDCNGVAGGPALPGTACDDGNAGTINDTWDANCVCAGTPTGGCTGNQVVVSITTDANPGQLSWEIVNAGGNVIANGTPATANSTVIDTACLGTSPANASYGFRMMDSFGDGIANGGWELRTTTGALILRDVFNSGSISPANPAQTADYGTVHRFGLPLGPVNIAANECGIMNNVMGSRVYAVEQGGTNYQGQTLNYQFEFSDPDAGFIRRITKPQNYVKLSDMAATNPIIPGVVHFARVRTDKTGPIGSAYWGAGCEMAISTTVTGCPQLIEAPDEGHSCNESRRFNDNTSFIYATPVQAARQYEFHITGPGYDQTFLRNKRSLKLKWKNSVAPPLVDGTTYNVEVRAKVSGLWGSYCGDMCTITIDNSLPQRPEHRLGQAGNATLWPNPVRDGQVNLSIDGLSTSSEADAEQRITVELQDLLGKRVFTQEFSNSGDRFSTILQLPGDLPGGVYLVNTTVNGESTVQRLSIIR